MASISNITYPNTLNLFSQSLVADSILADTLIVDEINVVQTAMNNNVPCGCSMAGLSLPDFSLQFYFMNNGLGNIYIILGETSFQSTGMTSLMYMTPANGSTTTVFTISALGILEPRGNNGTIYKQPISMKYWNGSVNIDQIGLFCLEKVSSTTVSMFFRKPDGSAFGNISGNQIYPFVFSYPIQD